MYSINICEINVFNAYSKCLKLLEKAITTEMNRDIEMNTLSFLLKLTLIYRV